MNNLLMIAYYYPPLAGVGIVRPLKFSRYLPEFGWIGSVLTVSNDTYYKRDYSELGSIPKGQKIVRAYRAPIFSTLRKIARKNLRKYPLLYSFVDEQFDWVPWAIRTGAKLLSSEHFDAIYVTAPPYSGIRVANALKRKFGIPVVADLRDPFSTNEFIRWPSPLHRLFYKAYESKLLNTVNRIIVVNEVMKKNVEENLGSSHPKPIVITNGYDAEEFVNQQSELSTEKFVFGYVGSLYGEITPRPFFNSLRLAFETNPEMKDKVEIIFMGSMQRDFILREAKRAGLSSLVRVKGFQPRKEAIKLMHNCHVLLLFGAMVAPSAVPAKLFEYAASGRPVLSFSETGLVEDFIVDNDFGFSVDGTHPKDGADKILYFFKEFQQGIFIPGPPREKYEAFSRKNLTRKLADVLNSVI